MSAILLALLVTAAPDAPVAPQDGVKINWMQPAPMSGILLSEDKAIELTRRVASAEAERDELKASHFSATVVILFIAAGVVLGGTAGFAIGKVTTK